jgi:membrane associated rhomboid family serine protease
MLTPWVSRIIFVNVAFFLLGLVEKQSPAIAELIRAMVLVPAFIPERPWTLVTYMFLHANLWHIFFNMLWLFVFGPRLEAELGGRRFFTLYFISGISGGLLSWPFSPYAAIIGASGAVFGVMLGFAKLWPRERIMIWFAVLEARYYVLLFMVLDLFGGFGGGDSIAHFAHLGGAAGAYLYLSISDRIARQRQFEAPKPRAPRISRGDLSRWARIQRETLHEVNREEYDRIMKKIDDEGIGSVTTREREFLDTFSDRAGPLH